MAGSGVMAKQYGYGRQQCMGMECSGYGYGSGMGIASMQWYGRHAMECTARLGGNMVRQQQRVVGADRTVFASADHGTA